MIAQASGLKMGIVFPLLAAAPIACSVKPGPRHPRRGEREPRSASWHGDGTHRRSFLAASAVTLAAPHIARAAQSALRMVPQANLTSIDPSWTTANITRNHGFMVCDTSGPGCRLFRQPGGLVSRAGLVGRPRAEQRLTPIAVDPSFMGQHLGRLVSRAGLVGRPRAEQRLIPIAVGPSFMGQHLGRSV